jgi:hypothetical protein
MKHAALCALLAGAVLVPVAAEAVSTSTRKYVVLDDGRHVA